MGAKEEVCFFRGDLAEQAQNRYDDLMVEAVYFKAIRDMSQHRQTRLIGDALALCGSPYWALSHAVWSPAVWEFLALFCE